MRHLSGDLIFPNIEMRLAVGTVKGKWVNVHLLVSPDDRDHLAELKRFLERLTFKAHGDTYCCNRDDLIRLGQRFDAKLTDPMAALQCGSEQFKITFDDLRSRYSDSAWAKENILIAIAGSETDGTSGIRDGADATLRREVEKFAHIIFASSTAQRDFWLGRRSLSADEIRKRYGDLKACMHGDPFGCDGTGRRHCRSPTVAASPAGAGSRIGPDSPYLGTMTLTLRSQRKSSPFYEENRRVIGPALNG